MTLTNAFHEYINYNMTWMVVICDDCGYMHETNYPKYFQLSGWRCIECTWKHNHHGY